MFFNSKQFQVMTGSLQALSMQQQAILHNLANLETPGYKSKSVSFVDVLAQEKSQYDMKAVITTDTNTSHPSGWQQCRCRCGEHETVRKLCDSAGHVSEDFGAVYQLPVCDEPVHTIV